MTVLRREDVQSRVASWDDCPCRIARSPILAIVPLMIRRLRGPSPNRLTMFFTDRTVVRVPLTRRGRSRLERCPQDARQCARDRHRDLRRRFVLFRQTPEATTQSLSGLVGNRNHAPRLSFASSHEGNPNTWPVLIVPRRFHQQPAHQRVV